MDYRKGSIIKREKKKVVKKQVRTENGIICGKKNPASFGCQFYVLEDGQLATIFTAEKFHEGHSNVIHGGLTASILDEVMGRCILGKFQLDNPEMDVPSSVTAEMNVKYLDLIRVGEPCYAYGTVVRTEGRKSYVEGLITDMEGRVKATSTGLYINVGAMEGDNDLFKNGVNSEPLLDSDPKEL